MAKILSVAVLVLAIGLFPPAVAALVSNNAVPGDATYPIKRLLEDGIYAVASLTPTTKAWFAAARSDRRFKEFSTLIAQGKSASDTLNELVSQTDIAANELIKVEDTIRKQELISQLSQSIDKYSQKLDEVAAPTPTATPKPPVVSPPADVTSPGSTATPRPISTPQPSAVPRPAPSPTPSSTQPTVDQEEIDDAKEKLEDIKDKLEKEKKKSHQEKREDKREDRKNDEKEQDKEKRNKVRS